MASKVSDSIKGMINGTMSLKDALKSLGQSFAGKLASKFLDDPINNLIDGLVNGTVSGGNKIPARANGGSVRSGKTYLVGERGPELFTGKGGNITPNNQLGGSQTINVTYSPQINALDPRTAATVIAQNAPTIVGVIRQAFNRNGQAVAL